MKEGFVMGNNLELQNLKKEYQDLKNKYTERSFKIMAINQLTSTLVMEKDIESLKHIISDMFFEVNLVRKAIAIEVKSDSSIVINEKNCKIEVDRISVSKYSKEFEYLIKEKVISVKKIKEKNFLSLIFDEFRNGYCICFDVSSDRETELFLIIIGDKVLGKYSEVDDEFLETISGQIGIILENAIYNSVIEKKNKELNETVFSLQVLNYSSSLLSTTLEIEELLKYTADIFFEIFDADKFMIFNFLEEKNVFNVYSSAGYEFEEENIEIKVNEIYKFRILSNSDIKNITEIKNDYVVDYFREKIRFGNNTYFFPLVSQNSIVGAAIVNTSKDIKAEFYNTLKIQITIALNNAKLYAAGITDGLTQAYNHMFFKRKLKAEMLKHLNTSIILLDIDYFKKFNDTYGHVTGDEVLREVSSLLRQAVRKYDIVARYGGEEFAILLPDTNLRDAEALAERLRIIIEKNEIEYKGEKLKITASFGVGEFNKSEILTLNEFVDNVDKALYESKRNGRNCVTVYKRKTKKKVTVYQKENEDE